MLRVWSRGMNLLPNPEEAVVVVALPKPNAVGAVVLAANEPNENPDVPSQGNHNNQCCQCGMPWHG